MSEEKYYGHPVAQKYITKHDFESPSFLAGEV
jgi:hypothetical protein